MFDKRRFLDLVRNFVSFVTEDAGATSSSSPTKRTAPSTT
jgi:hypothetical protein